jgi:hypothetical protein
MATAPPKSYSIYDNYNPVGEGGGTFAPPHIAGWEPSREATEKWYADRYPVKASMIDSLRQPVDDTAAGNSVSFGVKQGVVPAWALQSLAQGGAAPTQRDAIAAQMMANEQAGSQTQAPAATQVAGAQQAQPQGPTAPGVSGAGAQGVGTMRGPNTDYTGYVPGQPPPVNFGAY